MAKFRSKPLSIDAVQWDGRTETANRFVGDRFGTAWEYAGMEDSAILIPVPTGQVRVEVGEWIVRGADGEFYGCRDSIFRATYEPVE